MEDLFDERGFRQESWTKTSPVGFCDTKDALRTDYVLDYKKFVDDVLSCHDP